MTGAGWSKWAILVAMLIFIFVVPMRWFVFDNEIDSNEQAGAPEARPVPCEEIERHGISRMERARREGLLKRVSGNRMNLEEAHWERLPTIGRARLLSAFRCSSGRPEIFAYGFRREAFLGRATATEIELAP